MTNSLTKQDLLESGIKLITQFCDLNKIQVPEVDICDSNEPSFGTCAYYRDSVIKIWPKKCSALGLNGRSWSYPGYTVDRTPYGVLAHELGHHVERAHGPAGGYFSHLWRPKDPTPLTGYCPNNNEWFAELFRLYVTNPDLLKNIRPIVHNLMTGQWIEVVNGSWIDILSDSERHIKAAQNKINKANKANKLKSK